jgi:hypothetical protein
MVPESVGFYFNIESGGQYRYIHQAVGLGLREAGEHARNGSKGEAFVQWSTGCCMVGPMTQPG